jgi:hypothetical protein
METKRITIAGKVAVLNNKTVEVPFNHTEFDGMTMLHLLTEETAPAYLGNQFETRPQDVFLVSYSKSGSHWLAYIVNNIAKPTLPNKEDFVHRAGEVPLLEQSLPEKFTPIPSPRYMYTHLPYKFVPHSSQHEVKYVVIARNPRDIAVSQFNFMKNMKDIDFHGTWDEFLSLFMRGTGLSGSYFDRVLEWWEHQEDDNVLFLKYEDLKKDLTGQIGIIGNFLGYQLSHEEMGEIAEKCTFKTMKENRVGSIEGNKGLLREGKSFYRKGIVGDWRNYFSDEQLEKFNQWCNSHLEDTGLEFDFG